MRLGSKEMLNFCRVIFVARKKIVWPCEMLVYFDFISDNCWSIASRDIRCYMNIIL
jgi:hypothetical protein